MSATIIAKNQTVSGVVLADLGVMVPGSGQVTLTESLRSDEILGSPDLQTEVLAGNIVLFGTEDIPIAGLDVVVHGELPGAARRWRSRGRHGVFCRLGIDHVAKVRRRVWWCLGHCSERRQLLLPLRGRFRREGRGAVCDRGRCELHHDSGAGNRARGSSLRCRRLVQRSEQRVFGFAYGWRYRPRSVSNGHRARGKRRRSTPDHHQGERLVAVTFIAENQAASPVVLADLGKTVPASGSVTLTSDLAIGEIWGSADLQTAIEAGQVLLNDGVSTLSKSQSLACMSDSMSAPVDLSTYNVYAPIAQFFTGTVTVATTAERRASAGFQVGVGGEVTVSTAGRCLVRGYCSVLGGSGGRQQAEAWLEHNAVEVLGTRGELYRRNTTTGGTCAMEAELDLLASDVVRLRVQVTLGTGAVNTRANGSAIVLERIGR